MMVAGKGNYSLREDPNEVQLLSEIRKVKEKHKNKSTMNLAGPNMRPLSQKSNDLSLHKVSCF
jgi:hypothetical protein